MKRKFQGSPRVFLNLLLAALGLIQVAANTASQQQNGSLPALSERANGVNSRYLSAASTASLAAATVAASNAVPQGGSVNSNTQEANNRNYLIHQQQQQLQQQHQQQQQQSSQQQQQIASSSTANNNNQIVNTNQISVANQQHQQPQQTAILNLPTTPAAQQYSNAGSPAASPQQVAGTPIMSTTFTFNPLTGQYVPTDLSTGSLPNNGYGPYFVAGNQQQQLPFGTTSYGQLPPQALISSSPYAPRPQRFSPNLQQSLPYGSQFLGAQRQQAANQFLRRNGYGPSSSTTSGSRNNPFGQQQQPSALVEDDTGFFQQQVASSGSSILGGLINGADQLVGSNSFGLPDSLLFGNLPGNSYLANSNNPQQQQQVSLNHHLHHGYNALHANQQQAYGNEQAVANLLSQSSQASSVAAPAAASLTGTPTNSLSSAYSSNGQPAYDQCVAADGRHGTCYQASECIRRGGTPMGKCGTASNEYSGSSYVCCLFDVSCGQFAAERFVYFRNPNYPNTYDQSRMCRAKIGKLDKGTCQFRLDMIRFDVAKPTNGNCSTDMFVVSGQNENYVIPKICGLNDGQHYYVGVDESGVITLHMMMMGYYRRNFDILITQIPCRSDYAAPAHCLQYYLGTHGTIKSFNYDDDYQQSQQQQQQSVYDLLQAPGQQADGSTVSLTGNPTQPIGAPYGINFGSNSNQLQQRQQQLLASASQQSNRYFQQQDHFGGYPNDLDYTMCIRKESGFCSITYQLSRSDQGLQPFAVGQSPFGYNDSQLNGQYGSSSSGWHPVSTECRDDYLLIGGVRLCSASASAQFPLVGGGIGSLDGSSSIQFAQNGSILNSAGIGGSGGSNQQQVQLQAQQLQNQYQLILQQLARIQQQQQVGGNVTYANGAVGQQSAQQQQLQSNGNGISGGSNGNLEQQQAALIQQSQLIQQQLNYLAANNHSNNNRYSQQQSLDGQFVDSLQGAIITDTTSGPFILRFVSNLARNARGFHIDYRQNPCK